MPADSARAASMASGGAPRGLLARRGESCRKDRAMRAGWGGGGRPPLGGSSGRRWPAAVADGELLQIPADQRARRTGAGVGHGERGAWRCWGAGDGGASRWWNWPAGRWPAALAAGEWPGGGMHGCGGEGGGGGLVVNG
jgi:hypothetical protein